MKPVKKWISLLLSLSLLILFASCGGSGGTDGPPPGGSGGTDGPPPQPHCEEVTWEKIFVLDGYQYASSVQVIDGGYVIGGSDDNYLYLMKIDMYGNVLWSRTFLIATAVSLQTTKDGGYIVAGGINNDIFLLKADENGNDLWFRTLGGANASSIKIASDGGFIIAGYSNFNIVLIKTDVDGSPQWSKTYEKSVIPYSMQNTSDGGYIITGWSSGFPHYPYLLKVDVNGNEQWFKSYNLDGAEHSGAFSVQIAIDGGYIIAGEIGNYDGVFPFILKTDINGNKQWVSISDRLNEYSAKAVQNASDGGYIIAASVNRGSVWHPTTADIHLIKFDANGNEKWATTFGGEGGNSVAEMQVTCDGGYIICGNNNANVYMIKTDHYGYVTP